MTTATPPDTEVSSRRGRCAWSGADADDLEPVEADAVDRFGRPAGRRVFWVRPRHRDAFLAFNAYVFRWARWFLPSVTLCVGIMIAASAMAGQVGLGFGLLVLGTLMLFLPFATPETVEMLGVRKSVVMTRGMAVLMILAGLLFITVPGR